ncbi:MAG TPA: ABC transporter substrate-binding protein [Methylomirabilota bacterium]|nr:ABC transporter substrate-binding protein [Methylomirabilota bacterium]
MALMAVGLLAAPRAAEAQQAGRVYRIGLLEYSAPDAARQAWWIVFRQRMRELGYVEGQNVTFEPRWAQDDNDRLSKLAAELVGLKVDLIVTAASPSALAAKRATATIPIVMATGADPVAVGLVASLRQPGGNVTGMTTINSELAAKRLELLRIVAPRAARIAILWEERNLNSRLAVDGTEAAAKTAGFTIHSVPVRSPAEIEAAFATVVRGRAGALSIVPSPMLFSHRKRLAELAMKHRLPTIGGNREYAEAGGLVSYGADFRDMFRGAAVYVDKILKGAKPADLPVEQPTKFELVINLKTAKALGLTIPHSLLLRADEVIQ